MKVKPPPHLHLLGCGRVKAAVSLRSLGASEDCRMIWPEFGSVVQAKTGAHYPKECLPCKSCLQLHGEDLSTQEALQTTLPQIWERRRAHIPTAQMGRLEAQKGEGANLESHNRGQGKSQSPKPSGLLARHL